jgi:hypothetical protein
MKKMFVVFALSGMAILSAKTYSVTIGEPAIVGTSTLKAGSYKLKIDGNSATLTDAKGSAVEATGVAASADRKFTDTAVAMSTDTSGQNHVQEIDLGGTRTKVSFNQ